MTRFYVDTADRDDAEPLLRSGLFYGITTNPTLLDSTGVKVSELDDFYAWAVDCGARYLAPYLGRMDDAGRDGLAKTVTMAHALRGVQASNDRRDLLLLRADDVRRGRAAADPRLGRRPEPAGHLDRADGQGGDVSADAPGQGGRLNLLTVDTRLNDPSDLSSQISSDNVAGGALGADTMAKLIGDKGKVVAISEPPGSSTDDQRVEGFVKEMKAKHPDITVLTTQYADHSAQATASKVSSILVANPDLKGAFAVDNFTGDGAPIGVRNANARSRVKIGAFDAQPSQIQALQSGDIDRDHFAEPLRHGRARCRLRHPAGTG
jgi:hypothetical protein